MLKHIFEPLTVKGLTIPNRLVVSPMVTNYCDGDGFATERFIRYHETKAEGGFGLIITEDYAIDPAGKGFSNVAGLWDDSQIAGHKELPLRIHKYGAKVLAQVYHAGRQTSSPVIGQTPVAPSAIADPFSLEVPRELTVDEIEKIIEQFGDCALRAKKCGFDGVELHGGHGYLIAEFLSPYSNKRLDEYGGPLINRVRFALAVIKNVRQKVGDDFVIDFRISGDELVAGGRTIEDTKTIVPLLAEAGLDMVHITAGVYASANKFLPPQYVRHGVFADLAHEVKKVTDIPVIMVGRVNDPFLAEELLASGKADMVAMGRQSLADPAFPRKAREGRFDEIRQCIACNAGCLANLFENKPINCVLNPTVGLEYLLSREPAEVPKDIAVIGGGPGGMQAAISAAERGHKVTLYEKSNELGGQFRLAAMPPAKGEISSFLTWQRTQMKKLGVTVKINYEATVDNIGQPEVVILASGGQPIRPQIPGLEEAEVVMAEDVLSGKVLAGPRVVIIGGGQVGAETADYLSILGRQVTVLEMTGEIAPKEAMAPRYYLLNSLKESGVRLLTNTKVNRISRLAVETECGQAFEADTVVLAVGVRSDSALNAPLEAKGFQVQVIGDAKNPGQVLEAIRDAHEAAIAMQ